MGRKVRTGGRLTTGSSTRRKLGGHRTCRRGDLVAAGDGYLARRPRDGSHCCGSSGPSSSSPSWCSWLGWSKAGLRRCNCATTHSGMEDDFKGFVQPGSDLSEGAEKLIIRHQSRTSSENLADFSRTFGVWSLPDEINSQVRAHCDGESACRRDNAQKGALTSTFAAEKSSRSSAGPQLTGGQRGHDRPDAVGFASTGAHYHARPSEGRARVRRPSRESIWAPIVEL
jgi:hypothetical protein